MSNLELPWGVLAAAWVLVIGLGPITIKALKAFKIGQMVRSDGPGTHLKKAGTPTMGGVLFIGVMVIVSLLGSNGNPLVILAALGTFGFGVIGFVDDFRKLTKNGTTGLKAREKLLAQGLLALIICGAAVAIVPELAQWIIPFSSRVWEVPHWLFLLLAVFITVGCANAVNLTDGLDGLAAGCMVVAGTVYAVILTWLGLPMLYGIVFSLVGACLGFLWFNAFPAAIFMGDTGSLALGAVLAFLGLFSGTALFLPLVGLVFVLETVSVILQVVVFRLAGGRRLFRMAPLHHHFELIGWAEPKVILRFWLAAAMGGVLTLWIL